MFTVDPAERFAQEYDVKDDVWHELWRRYKLLAYTVPELCEYMEIKQKKKIGRKFMHRWITRNEIYIRAIPIVKKGVQTVDTVYFRELEKDVIDEITRNMRYRVSRSSRLMA
jgi:hypothetical protein